MNAPSLIFIPTAGFLRLGDGRNSGFAYQRGWHRYLWSHRVPVGIVAAPALVAVVWLGWSLGSPLFTNTTVDALFFTRIARTREDAMETHQLTFTLERETKNTVR
ncbi:MAG: hypothetical protein OSB07_12420, partial [Dehalococcoidia bacterium]|nr:hypothetical protein [Dehalococcoidia bacterium]